MPNTPLQERILRQRTMLHNMLLDPMRRAARRCARVWNDKELLDTALMKGIRQIPYCTYLYAQWRQLNSTLSHYVLRARSYVVIINALFYKGILR